MLQKKDNIGYKIFKEEYQQQSYELYNRLNNRGIHVHHKLDNYDATMTCRLKLNRYEPKVSNRLLSKPKQDHKLILSKNMKAALVIVRAFTEE